MIALVLTENESVDETYSVLIDLRPHQRNFEDWSLREIWDHEVPEMCLLL